MKLASILGYKFTSAYRNLHAMDWNGYSYNGNTYINNKVYNLGSGTYQAVTHFNIDKARETMNLIEEAIIGVLETSSGKTTPCETGAYQGSNGQRIFDQQHNDIDESTINVSCRSGSCEVHLDERIWGTWSRRNDWNLNAGGRVNTTVEVASSWFDGDHRLFIIATSDGTRVYVSFCSRDR